MKKLLLFLLAIVSHSCVAELTIKPLGTDTLYLHNSASSQDFLDLEFLNSADIGKIILISYSYDAEKNKKLEKLEEYTPDRKRMLIGLDWNNYLLQIRRIAGRDEHDWPILQKTSFSKVFKVSATPGHTLSLTDQQTLLVGNLGMSVGAKRLGIAMLLSALLIGGGALAYVFLKNMLQPTKINISTYGYRPQYPHPSYH